MRLIKILLFILISYSGFSQNIGIRQVRGLTNSLNLKLNKTFGAQGSLLFRGATGISQSNSNLFYDSTNRRVGINTNTPANSLHVVSTVRGGGITLAGSDAPAFFLADADGTLRGSVGLVSGARDYFSNSIPKDISIRAQQGGRLLLGALYTENVTVSNPAVVIDSVNNVSLIRLKNNAAGDSVLTTDINGTLKLKLSTGGTGSSSYTLPTASATTLGGVKVGTGLSIDGTGVLSSTGGSGGSTTDTTSLSRRINRKPRVYNVEDYGAVHDGVTNDQTAIQAAINAAHAAGGGVVYFPNGVYILSGAVDASSGAQLYVPLSTYNRTDTARVIKLMGETSPNQYSTPLADATSNQQMPTTGVVLQSTLQGSTGAIIGSRSQTVTWGTFNFAELQIENIITRAASRSGTTNTAATQTAIDGSKLAFINIKNVRVDVQPASDSIVQPATTGVGIYMPKVNNFAITTLDNVMITGYYKAMIVSEHNVVNNLMIDGCYIGLSLEGINNHANQFNRLGIYRTKYNIQAAAGQGQINISELAIEDKMTGTEWFVNSADLNETGGTWQGSIKFARVESNTGIVNSGFRRATTAASAIKTTDITGTTIYQPSASSQGVQFAEQGTVESSIIGRTGSAFATSGSILANTGYFYGSKNVALWTGGNANKIQFLTGATPSEVANMDGITGSMNLPFTYAGNKTITITNSSANAAGQAIFSASNGTSTANYGMTGTAYTTYGALVANSGYLYSSNANGLTFMADNASGLLKFATGGNAEKMRLASSGNLLVNTTTDANSTYKLQVNGIASATQYKLSALNTAPASATSTGTLGEVRIDASFIYVCVATNTWVRAALATW